MQLRKVLNLNEITKFIFDYLMKNYWVPLYNYVKANPNLIETVSGFLLNPEQIVFYLGKKHLAVEYIGPERLKSLEIRRDQIEVKLFDFSLCNEDFFEKIIGFKFDATHNFNFLLTNFSEELIFPTNAGFDKLEQLNWNFAAQGSMMIFNGRATLLDDSFTRVVNSIFFDADKNGLKTRYIKWLDILPIKYDDSGEEYDKLTIDFKFLNKLVKHDCNYEYYLPKDFKYKKLPQINRFIELIGNNLSLENEITNFLEKKENQFILTMGFLSKNIYSQLICEWQSEDKENIKPDFFVLRPNGYADIVEFKLPRLKTRSVVGITNRETFSSELNSYISQTRVYRDYFDDPNNRKWFENKYGFKVHKPKRYLVVARRWDFDSDVWKEIISDYKDIEIMTYEDLIDGVTAQFYK